MARRVASRQDFGRVRGRSYKIIADVRVTNDSEV
jgi:hypothetical protein